MSLTMSNDDGHAERENNDVVVLFLSDSVCDFPKRRAIGDSDMRGHRETIKVYHAHTADRQTYRQLLLLLLLGMMML